LYNRAKGFLILIFLCKRFFVLDEQGHKEENKTVTKENNDKETEKEEQENVKDEKKVTELKQASIKKRRSNIEKSLEVVFNQFKQTSKDEFGR
jgi:DNA-directed RNA polymerase subunit M/transcription elongation factor TFIIS